MRLKNKSGVARFLYLPLRIFCCLRMMFSPGGSCDEFQRSANSFRSDPNTRLSRSVHIRLQSVANRSILCPVFAHAIPFVSEGRNRASRHRFNFTAAQKKGKPSLAAPSPAFGGPGPQRNWASDLGVGRNKSSVGERDEAEAQLHRCRKPRWTSSKTVVRAFQASGFRLRLLGNISSQCGDGSFWIAILASPVIG